MTYTVLFCIVVSFHSEELLESSPRITITFHIDTCLLEKLIGNLHFLSFIHFLVSRVPRPIFELLQFVNP